MAAAPPETTTREEEELDDEKQRDSDRTPPRFPRWTRNEIMVLIEAKRLEECKGRRSRAADAAACPESKWVSISSYCKRHGVNREAVQCRKRWTTLWRDFKRIRDWDALHSDHSFWLLSADAKRDSKLPAFFDRELYAELEKSIASARDASGGAAMSAEPHTASAVLVEEGLVEELEHPSSVREEYVHVVDDVEDKVAGSPREKETLQSPSDTPSGVKSDKLPTSNGEKVSTSSGAGQKRMRVSSEVDEDRNLKHQLLSILERNGQVLTAHVEAHNLNCQLDRNQRNEHAESLVGVLGKLADALGRIADKLQ